NAGRSERRVVVNLNFKNLDILTDMCKLDDVARNYRRANRVGVGNSSFRTLTLIAVAESSTPQIYTAIVSSHLSPPDYESAVAAVSSRTIQLSFSRTAWNHIFHAT